MKNLLIIQSRMGSTRLPGKVLKPLGATDNMDYVVSRCRAIIGVDEVVVATSTLPGDDALETWCREFGVPCFRGSEQDVLARYYFCAKEYHPDYVIRVTADCPFLDYQLAGDVLKLAVEQKLDYVFYPPLPHGLVIEPIPFAKLEWMHFNTTEDRHREHVTYYLNEYREQYQTLVWQLPEILCHPELRLTLDTAQDYQLLSKIADHFSHDKLIPTQDVITYLLANPDIASINSTIQQKKVF
jgi:spore coat polysaccharide biosynthesis protein SpsF